MALYPPLCEVIPGPVQLLLVESERSGFTALLMGGTLFVMRYEYRKDQMNGSVFSTFL
jgi:hypothetical protein